MEVVYVTVMEVKKMASIAEALWARIVPKPFDRTRPKDPGCEDGCKDCHPREKSY
jgi:hypothetical protein